MSRWDAITEEQYNVWRHHPVSAAMFAYYTDYARVLERELIDRWKRGVLISQDEQEIRGRVNTLAEIVDQPFEAIKQFYLPVEVNGENDAA